MSRHIALLGDSSIDNARYTRRQPDVANHLRSFVGAGDRVSLLAVDGSTTLDLGPQLDRITAEMTHLVVSIGGNDALLCASLLDTPVRSTGEALDLFGVATDEFARNHRNALEALRAFDRAIVVCTIYEGNLGATEGPRARVALKMWNDIIVRNARGIEADVIELRDVCNELSDFANPIEPSGIGGRKIARAIATACR